MGGMKFEYDENGAKFVYFALSFYVMIIVPVTYYFWPRKEEKKSFHSEDLSCFEPCRIKNQLLNQSEPKKKVVQKIIKVVLIVAWIVFFVMAYKASQIEIEHKEYDPFVVLGIDRESTDKEIRKQYRELSKVMHPDKGGDEDKFKELTKAYKALTDEEAKNNWKEYGNPDGPGVMQFGIALPKWIVEGKNSYIVLGIYLLIFMIIMPTIVGLWWYKSIKYTGDQVLMRTSQLFGYLLYKSPSMNIKRIIMTIGSSLEFDRHSNPEIQDRASDNVELPQLMKDLPELQEKIREAPFSYMYSIKTRTLIHAHLARISLAGSPLLNDKSTVVKKCPFLINELLNTAGQILNAIHANYASRNIHPPPLETFENIMRLSPMIVQALWNKTRSNLLQLPHITENHLRHFVTKKRNITNIKQFVSMNDADRRSILRHLTDDQYEDIMRVCALYPQIEMSVKVKIIDDEDEHTVTAGALVTLVVNLKRENLTVNYDKEDNPSKLKAVADSEFVDGGLDGDEESAANGGGDPASASGGEAAKPTAAAKSTHKPWEKQQKKKLKTKTKSKPKAKTPTKAAPKTTAGESGAAKKEATLATDNDNDADDAELSDTDQPEQTETNNSEHGDSDSEEEEQSARQKANDSRNSAKSKSAIAAEKQDTQVETLASSSSTVTAAAAATATASNDDEYFEKFQQMQKKREKLETKLKISHRVYCPFFPDIKQECWWLYIADKKQNSIICTPVYLCSLKDTEEAELKFLAPKTPGNYSYSVILKSDSYVDFDVIQQIKLDVNPAKKIDEHPQWNFSDDEGANNNGENEQDDEFNTESESDS